MRKPTWKKDQVKATIDAIAGDVAQFFGVALPEVMSPIHASGREWEYQIDVGEVWTKAGKAELTVNIDSKFAHLYFRFDDVARAIVFDDHMGRLNRCSGKWNRIATPSHDALDVFRAELRHDFRKVAELNPDPAEVETYRAKETARNAAWEEYLESVL